MSCIATSNQIVAMTRAASHPFNVLRIEEVLSLPLFIIAAGKHASVYPLAGGGVQLTWSIPGSTQMFVWQVDQGSALLLADNKVHMLSVSDLYTRLRAALKF